LSALPIIAMTAHATVEERQRCLDTGMNDHISKPIDPGNLFETVGRYYRTGPASQAGASDKPENRAPVTDGDLPVIDGLDTREALARVMGKRDLYLRLLRQFATQQGLVLGEISAALRQGDFVLAERLAHTLKGVAGNIGAKPVHSAAGALEKLIRDRAPAKQLESALQQTVSVLDPLLAQLRATLGAPGLNAQPSAAAATVPVDPAVSREAAAQLTKLLLEFDPKAEEFIQGNQPALRALFAAEAWAEFEDKVQNYSFSEAQAMLEGALKKTSAA
jgi:HPt (histidine-containing phosphotransfer) domain-containing protein